MAKKFLFACMGIFLLVAAYAVGAGNSVAQSTPTNIVSAFISSYAAPTGISSVVTVTGDIYGKVGSLTESGGHTTWTNSSSWTYMGNVFTGAPVGAEQNTIGGVKSLFR